MLLATLLAAGCFSPRSARDEDVRPLTVRVVDAETRQPLSGIPVSYAVQAMKERGRIFGLLPQIEPQIGPKLVFKARGRTDERGEVVFHARKVHLLGNERVDEDFAYVNLDVDLGHRSARIAFEVMRDNCSKSPGECPGPADEIDVFWMVLLDQFMERVDELRNPVATHRGVVVMSDRWQSSDWKKDWTDPDDRFRVRWNSASLKKGSDVIEVALERYVPEPELAARIAAAVKALESGKADSRAAYASVARDSRSLAFHAGSAEARAAYREKEREAYRGLTRVDAANPEWFLKLADTFNHVADRVPSLREGVERFPRDYGLRRALGSAMCRTEARREGLEHLKEAARLMPGGLESWEASSLETDIRFCGNAAPD